MQLLRKRFNFGHFYEYAKTTSKSFVDSARSQWPAQRLATAPSWTMDARDAVPFHLGIWSNLELGASEPRTRSDQLP